MFQSGELMRECICCVLTVWRSCWGRSPGVTPDGAPCCCTPPSCRTPGFSHRFSAARNQTMMPPRSRRRCCRRSAAGSQTTATDPASFSHRPRRQCFDSRRVVNSEIQTPLKTTMRPEPVSCLAQVRLPPPFLARLSLRSGKRCSSSLSAKRLIYNSLSIPAWCSCPPTPLVCRAECARWLLKNLSSCWEGFFVGPSVGSNSRCRLFFFPREAAAVVPGYPHVLITSGNSARLFLFFFFFF